MVKYDLTHAPPTVLTAKHMARIYRVELLKQRTIVTVLFWERWNINLIGDW